MSEDILERLPDAVVVVGSDRSITLMNRAAGRMTGWNPDEAVGRFWGDIVKLRDTRGFLLHEREDPFDAANPLAARAPEREFRLYRRDGGERRVAVRTSYRWSEDGKLEEMISTIRDIGRRARLERSAYDLIATLAHDLRSPLTSIKGFTATLKRNWDRFGEEQKLHMLNTIDWDADRMNRLLRDLLDLSRLEAGRLELKRREVNVAELATQVAERVAREFERTHTVTVDFPEDLPPVMADLGKVEQVLTNLIENAAKHGDPGPIDISGRRDGHSIVVRVADAGPGIESRHVPFVFSKFYRRSERHSSGTGLGLFIAKGIIDAHGGDIRIERTGSSGTVFVFTLPLEP